MSNNIALEYACARDLYLSVLEYRADMGIENPDDDDYKIVYEKAKAEYLKAYGSTKMIERDSHD